MDAVIGRAAWQTKLLSQNLVIDLEGARVPVVDAPGFILLKLYAGGTQDLWDIDQMLAAGERGALIAAVDQRVAVLPADPRARWQHLRRGT